METNKIILGDSFKLLKEIPDKSIDLIVTDPPYLLTQKTSLDRNASDNIFTKKIMKIAGELKESELDNFDTIEWCKEAIRVMKKINIYIWCSKLQIPMYFDFFIKEHGCNFNILEWIKTNPVPNFKNQYSNDKEFCLYFRKGGYCVPKDMRSSRTYFLQPINIEEKERYGHPTIKPLNIIKQLIENSSKEGEVVLDPFIGSGTTAVACVEMNRQYLGMEKNEKFYNIALKRVEEAEKSPCFL